MMAIGVRTCRVLLESGFTGYSGAACAHDIDAQLKMAIGEGIIPGPRIRACGHHIGTTGDMNNQDALVAAPRRRRRRPRRRRARRAAYASSARRSAAGWRRSRSSPAPATASPGRTGATCPATRSPPIVDDRARARRQGARPRDRPGDDPRVPRRSASTSSTTATRSTSECIERMAEAGTFWVPSLVYPWSLLEIGYAPHFGVTREAFDHVRAMLPIAQQAGVRILDRRRLQRRAPRT